MKNVISIRNAGKREHGEKHWFWCVWVDVEGHTKWNNQEPTASGYCESKRLARHAAWDALGKSLPESEVRRAYFTSWAWDYMYSLREKDDRPHFSRCSIGANRWLWVVGEYDQEPIATGIAESADAAKKHAQTHVTEFRPTGNWLAKFHWEKQQARKRSQSVTSKSSTCPLEFVYRESYSDDFFIKHRIVKRTKNRIYIERRWHVDNREFSGEWHEWVERAFVLDRAEFEADGSVWSQSASARFYASPEIYLAAKRSNAGLECHKFLDVEFDATEEQITSAYRRLAKTLHPDMGGDPEDFKRLRNAFDEAVAIVKERAKRQ